MAFSASKSSCSCEKFALKLKMPMPMLSPGREERLARSQSLRSQLHSPPWLAPQRFVSGLGRFPSSLNCLMISLAATAKDFLSRASNGVPGRLPYGEQLAIGGSNKVPLNLGAVVD